jgi:hypothetical protein
MVPTGIENEWTSFLSSSLANGGCVSLADCDNYSWSASGFGACSSTCGGGTATQTVSCLQYDSTTNVTTVVANSLCPASTMPSTTESCNTGACPTPPPPPAIISKIDIAGFYTSGLHNHAGTGTLVENASGEPGVVEAENGSGGVTFIVTQYKTDGSSQQVTSQSSYPGYLFAPVACGYQPNIAAHHQCFASANVYTTIQTNCSPRNGCQEKFVPTETSFSYIP